MFEYFLVDNDYIVEQLFIVILSILLHIYIIINEIKKYNYITIKAYYFIFSLFFLAPYIMSISYGGAGFASKFNYGFSLLTFFLLMYQIFLLPFYWYLSSKLLNNINISFSPRFIQTRWIIVFSIVVILTYILLYFIVVKPGLYYFMIGDIASAKTMRIVDHIGSVSATKNVSYIFNFLGLIKPFALVVVVALFFYYKSFITKFFLFSLFLIITFMTFSKGALAAGLVYFFIVYLIIRKPKKLIITSFLAFIVIISLLLFYITISSNTNLDGAISRLLLRFYNNSSSAYGQLEMYNSMSPLWFKMSDWGFVGRLLDVERFIPKEEIYPYLFPTQKLAVDVKGQGGSFLLSELYLFSGHFFIIFLFFTTFFMELINKIINNSKIHYNNFLEYYLLISSFVYLGVVFVQNLLKTPFGIFNPLLFGFRIEIWIWIFSILLLFKVKVYKNISR